MTMFATPLTLALAVAAVLPAAAPAATLEPFPTCSTLIDYGNHFSYRFAYRPLRRTMMPLSAAGGGAESDQAASKALPATGGPTDTSTTNVQEAGVDEPDVVKTDGTRILALARGRLYAVDVAGPKPVLAGSVGLPGDGWGQSMLVAGNRALVAWNAWDGSGERAMLAEVDVTTSGAMRVLRTLAVDGSHVASRLTGTTVRAVVRSRPDALDRPVYRTRIAGRAGYRFRRAKRAAHWLPGSELRDRMTGTVERHAAVGCGDVQRAPVFSGLQTVTVLTIDLARGLDPIDTDAVLTDAETVYASPTGLYVATQRYVGRAQGGPVSLVHRFDISDPARTEYRGTGVVPGTLLNQFSLSEHGGILRAATTREQESFVTTLSAAGLAQLGQVGGLGKGERIYAVRFIGDVGYVVTFRETDPLYTVDLSNPANPRVIGELKIRGYSAYLHPAGDGLLIGVGQDATDSGETLGTQLSLFDVSDLANPRRLQQRVIAPDSYSDAEYDHHAFLWWPQTGLAVLPVSSWSQDDPFYGAVGLSVDPDGIDQAGTVEHPGNYAVVTRSLVAGGKLYTLSEQGLMQSTLSTLARTAWVAF